VQSVGAGRYGIVGAIALVLSFGSGCLIDRSAIRGGIVADAAIDASRPDEDTGSTCGPSQTACGESCVDLTSDSANCGACGAACPADRACVASSCVCSSPEVYGVCGPGLRVWLDARDPQGDGSMAVPGPLTRWANLARSDVGDATAIVGVPEVALGAGGRPVVQLEMATLETSGSLTSASAHLEILVVARTRAVTPAPPPSTRPGPAGHPLSVELPGREGVVWGLPAGGASVLTTPWGRATRHTTLWHAFSGAEGTELRIDGVVVARAERRGEAAVGGPLLVGGSAEGSHQSVDVSEVLVFDRPLSEAERATITGALLTRWELAAPAAPSDDGLQLWLDARQPLTGEMPADDALLARWDDRSTRSGSATTTGVTWTADGLGLDRPAVVLAPARGPSHVEMRRPVSGDFTALVVLATEDGSGESEGWSSPCVLGADSRFLSDDAALVLSGGRFGWGREPGATPLSPARYDDGEAHLVVLRRRADDAVEMWVDHEPVLAVRGSVLGVTSPASWWLGRHPDAAEGALSARYGEVLVYDRVLGGEELARAERYLSRRWSTPPAGRQPRLAPCAPGSHLACPVRSLAELRAVPSGRYWIDLGRGPSRVSIDDAEGGGWALVLQYVRAGGDNSELDVILPGQDWPEQSSTALGMGDPIRSVRRGHLGADAASLLREATELRWYGVSAAHPRVVHFRSTVGVDGWRRGVNEMRGLAMMHERLSGATSALPRTANFFGSVETRDTILTAFPFFQAGFAHWGIRGHGSRWETDDYVGGAGSATIHRVWAR